MPQIIVTRCRCRLASTASSGNPGGHFVMLGEERGEELESIQRIPRRPGHLGGKVRCGLASGYGAVSVLTRVWPEMWVRMDSAWVSWQLALAQWSADGLCGSRVDMLCMHIVEVGRMRSFLALDLVNTRGISKEFFIFNLRVFVKE